MKDMMIDKIWIQKDCGTFFLREMNKTIEGCLKLGYNYQIGGKEPENYAPLGSVDFCIDLLGYNPHPDFYPEWLQEYRHRKIIFEDGKYNPFQKPCFIKPAHAYKAWEAKIIHPWETPPAGGVWMSEVVKFEQEWRYYIADGCILDSGWYDGNNENEPAPYLNIKFPRGWCGAIDFGRLDNGKICLVESQHPFACGWYGEDSSAYVTWLIEGWKYMLSQSF